MTDNSDDIYLDAYKVQDPAPALMPARSTRQWMDDTQGRVPYRCLPMTMANATGWEITCPFTIDINWNGGPAKSDIKITSPDINSLLDHVVTSHFQNGIVTFHTGYLFRTPPGWAVWAMGPPNWPKDGVYPLSGLVETDWLPFGFTMNWQMTRPGTVRFEKNEPFCFITLSEHRRLDAIEPKIRRLSSNPQLQRDYDGWSKSRGEFVKKLERRDPGTVAAGWQRHYMRGETISGKDRGADHDTKRRLKKPKDLTGAALFQPSTK